MSTPVEITNLISAISPENIEKFCRLKFSQYDFERCLTGTGGFFNIDCSADKADPTHARAQRQFSDALKDGRVKVIGRVFGSTPGAIPMLVYSVPMKGSITSRSSKGKQADFAKYVLKKANNYMGKYNRDWAKEYMTGLFFFHDESGNFRLSLIITTEKRFRRFTYYVEQDTTGTKNRTFRYRMTNAANDKAASGEVERWKSFRDVEKAFSVEELTKEFYKELFAWYERAVASPEVIFPCETAKPKEGESDAVFRARVKSEQVIRLITRLLFVWFIKQKNLVPNDLFDRWRLEDILKSFELTKGDNYYRAILQNLFFATLNSEIDCRAFAADGSRDENREHFDIKTLYRYSDDFAIPKEEVLALFRSIPFLNGGLFECLDRGRDYYDGFSRNKDKVAHVPNAFFFDDDEKTLGLIPLLQRYNFTIDENAHDDQDIALDPELLGKVFENLLGAFNPETSTTARNATGSFYTPREIVNYMVDESLIAYLLTKLQNDDSDQADAQRAEHEKVLRQLFTDGIRPSDEALCHRLDTALTSAKILDPACGSGAFPMGMLLRMVELLRILRQIPAGESLYDLKLQLIENCIYGVDIQCIAVQISKLRFFISLVCEQTRSDDPATNFGINPLPNLETKFVAADSLIGLPDMKTELPGFDTANIGQLKTELWDIRHRHFQARTYREKKKLRQEDEAKRNEIKAAITNAIAPNLEKLTLLEAERAKVDAPDWQVRDKPQDNNYLITDLAPEVKENTPDKYDANARKRKLLDADIATEKKKQSTPATLIDAMTRQLTDWNPYDQNASSPYFDPEWMFNVKEGFDVVIGNPPYVDSETMSITAPNMRSELRNRYLTAKGNWDLFVIFIERSTLLVTVQGHVALIVPNKLISASYTDSLREYLSRLAIIEIRDYSHIPVFHKADVYPVTIFVQRLDTAQKSVSVIVMNDIESIDTHVFIPYCDFTADIDWSKYFQSKDVVSLLLKLRMKPKLSEHEVKIFGAATVSEAYEIKKVVVDSQHAQGKRLVNTGTIDPYCSLWGERPTQYIKGHYMFPVVADDALRLISNTRAEQSNSVKLIIAGMSKRVEAILDSGCYLAGKSTTIVLGENATLKPLLGILNSSVITFFLNTFYHSLKMAGGYINIGTQVISSLPVPRLSNIQKAGVTCKVQNILSAKEADPSADTSALEAEIDKIVYELYGLTPEEIAIVEAATAKALASGGKKDGKGAGRAKSATADGKAAKAAEDAGVATEDTGDEASEASTVEPPATTAPKRRGRPPRQQQPTEPPAASTSKRGDHQAPGNLVTDL